MPRPIRSICLAWIVVASLAVLLLLAPPARLASSGGPSAALELVAEGLTAPLQLVEPPDGSGRLFVIDQVGQIRIIAGGTLLPTPFLDLSARLVALNPNYDERGLLGLAFHPDYASNGRFFVYYSAPLRAGGTSGFNHTTHIAEFAVSADPNVADAASERLILQVDQPQGNHNGGAVAFGPNDGYLYISLGDGGGANDVGTGHVEDWYAFNQGGNGQDVTQNLHGSILRLDVDGVQPYAIPADNPFVGTEGLDEQWAYGFRNPYRISFDMGGDGALYVQDAGQNLWEEVSLVTAGGNYGWNVKEGTHCFNAADPDIEPDTCPDLDPEGDPLIDPIIEFANSNAPDGGLGVVSVGGYVYRGTTLPEFEGDYIFGVWSVNFEVNDGIILVAEPQPEGLWPLAELFITNTPDNRLGHLLLGFGQDAAGEVYALTTNSIGPTGTTGQVYRLVPGSATAVTISQLSSQAGSPLVVMGGALLTLALLGGALLRRGRARA